jgi:hypothetical protein
VTAVIEEKKIQHFQECNIPCIRNAWKYICCSFEMQPAEIVTHHIAYE